MQTQNLAFEYAVINPNSDPSLWDLQPRTGKKIRLGHSRIQAAETRFYVPGSVCIVPSVASLAA